MQPIIAKTAMPTETIVSIPLVPKVEWFPFDHPVNVLATVENFLVLLSCFCHSLSIQMTFGIICQILVNDWLYILSSDIAKGTGFKNLEFAPILETSY